MLGWVTVFGGHTTLISFPSHPGQFSLLPSAGREMSTGQRAVMLCGSAVRQDGSYNIVDKCVGGRKNCVIPLNTCHPERFRNFMIKRYTNPQLLLLFYH